VRVKNGREIDLQGKTLMPGLIDAHVHPGNVGWYLSQTVKLAPAVYVHRVTRTLETDLQLGFTTLRDAGGLDAGFREAIEQGLIKGPRLFLSITPLTQKDAAGKPDPRNSLGIAPEACHGAEEMRQAVHRTLARGADQIKVFPDGEVVSQSRTDTTKPGQEKFTVLELQAAVAAAKANGAYVMAHTYGAKVIQNCLNAGVRSIEHGNLMDEETAAMLAESRAYYVPTLTIYDLCARVQNEQLDNRTVEKLRIVGQKGMNALKLAYRAGVKIGSGSDIIGPLQYYKGRELVLKADVMGPMGAIVSATKTNAEMMGVSHRIGTLAPGKLADLIVVDGNPLADITLFERGLEKIVLVMKGGRIVKAMMN
jgi:imidazolonepropionase-like amidohydrolase